MKLKSIFKITGILTIAFIVIYSLKHGNDDYLSNKSGVNTQSQKQGNNQHTMEIPTLRTSLF